MCLRPVSSLPIDHGSPAAAQNNDVENNTATSLTLRDARGNVIVANTVTAGGIELKGGVKDNLVRGNVMSTELALDYVIEARQSQRPSGRRMLCELTRLATRPPG